MTKTLVQRLDDAKTILDQLGTTLTRAGTSLPSEISAQFRGSVDARSDVSHWKDLIEARRVAAQFLDQLENRADADDFVSLGATRARFHHARLVGAQAYLSLSWALADRITAMVGRILCSADGGHNTESPAQLVSHFLQKDRKKFATGAVFDSIRRTFGWPIAVSYALRNHFIHDGAQSLGKDFFTGSSSSMAFRISPDGWKFIETKTERYAIERTFHRLALGWPTSPHADLRLLLADCEREMDDALGILVGSACHTLYLHAGLLIGDDS
jgi:hypothetical protein